MMKCHVTFDEQGKIVSAAHLYQAAPTVHNQNAHEGRPVAIASQTVAMLDVPDEFAELSLVDVLRLHVDIHEELKLVYKEY